MLGANRMCPNLPAQNSELGYPLPFKICANLRRTSKWHNISISYFSQMICNMKFGDRRRLDLWEQSDILWMIYCNRTIRYEVPQCERVPWTFNDWWNATEGVFDSMCGWHDFNGNKSLGDPFNRRIPAHNKGHSNILRALYRDNLGIGFGKVITNINFQTYKVIYCEHSTFF